VGWGPFDLPFSVLKPGRDSSKIATQQAHNVGRRLSQSAAREQTPAEKKQATLLRRWVQLTLKVETGKQTWRRHAMPYNVGLMRGREDQTWLSCNYASRFPCLFFFLSSTQQRDSL
jgi:hypothetical protein